MNSIKLNIETQDVHLEEVRFSEEEILLLKAEELLWLKWGNLCANIFFVQLQIFCNLSYRDETACDIILAHAFNSAFLRRSWSDISSLLFVEVSKREPAFSGGFASKTSVSAPL